jgi:MoaA/NifB/PqqE/SkfB family radical SAM enzyme
MIVMSKKFKTGLQLMRSRFSTTPYVVLYVTNDCDLNCEFCFNRPTRLQNDEQLEIQHYKKLASSIKRPFELLISGGEPFLRNDLSELLNEFTRHSNPSVITIPTNGSKTEKIDKVLKTLNNTPRFGRIHINLSIDAPGDIHDKIRGSEGLHKRIINSAKVIHEHKNRNPNIWLGTITVLGDHNRHHLHSIIEWVHNEIQPDMHDIGLLREDVERLPPNDVVEQYKSIQQELLRVYKKNTTLEYKLHHAVLQYFLDSVQKRSPRDGCRAGKTIVVITTEGKVYPCEPFWLSPERFHCFEDTCLGNLSEFNWDLPALLKQSKSREIISKIHAGQCSCFWECALFANVMFTNKGWFRIARAIFRSK